MKRDSLKTGAGFGILACVTLLVAAPMSRQAASAAASDVAWTASAASLDLPASDSGLFASHDVLRLTLQADLRQLSRDKGEIKPWRPASLSYVNAAGEQVGIPARVRTRGLWRLRHCSMPPLRLDIRARDARGTVFAGERRPKLVTYCMDQDVYEQYVLQEYLIYRVQALLTPYGHRARLAKVTYVDSARGGRAISRYGILLEDPEVMAARLGGKILEQKGAAISDLDPTQTMLLGMFQYLIGNTDWSIPGLHNIELVAANDKYFPVAYDFDWSGMVEARYARPDASLPIRSVRQRLYRGACVSPEELTGVLALFRDRREEIYALYRDLPDLDSRQRSRSIAYLDEFYRTIDDARALGRELRPACGR